MIDAQLFTAFIVAATILILMPGPMSERSAAVHARTLEHGRTAPSLKCGLSGLLASGALHELRPADGHRQEGLCTVHGGLHLL